MAKSSSLDRIAALQAEIESLQRSAVVELQEKRRSLTQEIAAVDAELAALTGGAAASKKRTRRGPAVPGRVLELAELKDLLARAPERTLSIRKDNLDLGTIKTLAAANPGVLRVGGKGAWPSVTLLK